MNVFKGKKGITPIISPSLGYKLRSINWDESFYFENPIDKEKINSIPKAIEIAKDIFLAVERAGMQYRETYRWDDHLYFKMTAEDVVTNHKGLFIEEIKELLYGTDNPFKEHEKE